MHTELDYVHSDVKRFIMIRQRSYNLGNHQPKQSTLIHRDNTMQSPFL